MTAKRLLDSVMLSYFRHLTQTDHAPSEAIDLMVGKLLVPSPEMTAVENRWLRAITARLRAELTTEKTNSEDKETPLFEKIADEPKSGSEKATKKAK